MSRYLITRHGCNAANQHMTPRMDVAVVDADNAAAAVDKAGKTVIVYANQRLTAIHVNSAGRRVADFELLGAAYR